MTFVPVYSNCHQEVYNSALFQQSPFFSIYTVPKNDGFLSVGDSVQFAVIVSP